MRDYGKVHTTFWTSETIRSMSEDGRHLALYLLTCPHANIIGAFRLPDGYVCDDLQWGQERVTKGFAELLAKGFARRCEASKWVWICKHLEWNPPENPNQKKGARKSAAQIPDQCAWKLDFMRAVADLLDLVAPPPQNPSETLREPLLNQEQEQEQEQEQHQEQEQKQKSAPATVSTLPTMAAAVCVALKSCGVGDVNPGHLDLLRLLNGGVDIGAFVAAAKDAKFKRFAYVLGIVKNQHDEAHLVAGRATAAAHQVGETPRERRQRERMAQFAPGVTDTDADPRDTIDMEESHAPRLSGR